MHFETSFLISFLSVGFYNVSLTFCICVAFSTVLLLTGFVVLSETTLNDANLLALFRAVLWPWRTFSVHLKAPRFCFLWRECTVYPCWVCWSTVPSTSAAFLSTFCVSDHCWEWSSDILPIPVLLLEFSFLGWWCLLYILGCFNAGCKYLQLLRFINHLPRLRKYI